MSPRYRCGCGDGAAVKLHCDGALPGCPMPGACHLAAYCRKCDAQWEEQCPNHQAAA